MSKDRIGRWQLRWGIVYTGQHSWGGRSGVTLTLNGHIVGWRIGRRGWLVMPLHRLADR